MPTTTEEARRRLLACGRSSTWIDWYLGQLLEPPTIMHRRWVAPRKR